MKIDILCHDGSPLGVIPETIYGDDFRVGVGGSELALLTMAQHWKEKGYDVTLYNNPWKGSEYINQKPIAVFDPNKNRDFLIIFRSPTRTSYKAKGKKIWWSCDQKTIGDFKDFGQKVDQIITISEYHKNYFQRTYDLSSLVIDLPIRKQDYSEEDINYLKVPYRMMFSSVPDRGLDILARSYLEIKKRIPEVSLVITSDYRLWGASPNNHRFRSLFMSKKDVSFMGAVRREKLVEEQIKAEILAYPCVYDELFCYSVAEAQYAYELPITSSMGALETTNMGIKLSGNPNDHGWQKRFVDTICKMFEERDSLEALRNDVGNHARKRFDIDRISKEWDEKVFI